LQFKSNQQGVKKVRFWPLGLGLLLVFAVVNTWLNFNRDIPAILEYANETQRITGYATQIAILLIGVGLIIFWFRSNWPKSKG